LWQNFTKSERNVAEENFQKTLYFPNSLTITRQDDANLDSMDLWAGSGYNSVQDPTEMFLVLTGRKPMLEPGNSCRHSYASQRALPLTSSKSSSSARN
jgi:hypothetical protein